MLLLVARKKNSKAGKFLKKAGAAAKKGVKAVTKVVKQSLKWGAKELLEVGLPKAAPLFLYLFVNDPALIAKLPAKAKAKRKKAVVMADFIVNGIGMQRNHFMGILRNALMKRYKKSPEAHLADMMKGKVSGIGIVGDVIKLVGELIGLIKKLVPGKKAPSFSASDAPDPSDFLEAAPEVIKDIKSNPSKKKMIISDALKKGLIKKRSGTDSLANSVQNQPAAVEPGETINNETAIPADGGKKVSSIC